MNKIKKIDIQDMDKVLKYLTYFENPNNEFYHIEEISRIRDDGTHILNLAPHEYSEDVIQFIKLSIP